jgi:alkylation response protein AidB-like acyl-CoA dehydrogenase
MTTTTTPTDVVATMRALRPQIESCSDEAERLRRLPDAVVRLFKENGVFGMARPPEYGGMGLDLVTTMRAVEEVSIADASAGWCAAIGSGSIGTLPLGKDAAREVYSSGTCVAGVGAPSGRALPVEGGFRITGRWAYASGCQHSDWIFLGNLVFEGDRPRLSSSGQPEFRVAVVPMSEVEIIDTWHVSGLRGTGSHDVAADGVFVPVERTAAVALDGSAGDDAQYSIPMFTLFGLALVPVALGAARRAIDELLALAQGKTPMLTGSKLRDKPVVQHEIARAEAMLQAASAYLYETVAALMERADRREEIDMEMRARVKLAATYATDCAAQAVDIAYRLGGGTANFETSVLQRCFRDVHAVTQHFIVASPNYETVGRVLMGLEPGTPII